jgi:hypothetical protein
MTKLVLVIQQRRSHIKSGSIVGVKSSQHSTITEGATAIDIIHLR